MARFGTFELHVADGELRRAGVKVKLQEQPLRLLTHLLERAGEIVTRDELRERLWPSEFVDFDHGLNTAVRKLRAALDDSADNPRFVETLARRGYRFIAPVTWSGGPEPAPAQAPPIRRRTVLAAAIALAVIAVAVIVFRGLRTASPAAPPQIRALTSLATVIEAAISPDGKYLAYVTSENGLQALWLEQLATGTTLQLRPPAPIGYWGHSFHPDGGSIYYGEKSPTEIAGTLYRIPTIGGAPQKILEKIDSAAAVSPDGSRIAFYRVGPGHDESSLVVVAPDGGSERILRTWRLPEYVAPIFFGAPSWSPDGSLIACGVNSRHGQAWLSFIDAVDGVERDRTKPTFAFASQTAWLSKDELVFVGIEQPARLGAVGAQLWCFSRATGAIRPVTNDILDYRNPTTTADGASIVAVANVPFTGVWRVPLDGSAPPQKLPFGGREGLYGLSGAADGRVVLASPDAHLSKLQVAASDGSGRRLLSAPPEPAFAPAIAPDGKTVVYLAFTGSRLKLRRTSIDGGGSVDLCEVAPPVRPTISADGKWVYFAVPEGERQILDRVSIDGGRPEVIGRVDVPVFTPPARLISNVVVSPQGDRVAMFSAAPREAGLLVVSLRDGHRQLFPGVIPGSWGMLSWLPDGSGVLYSGTSNERMNVFLQKLDGTPAKPVTALQELELFRFACCRDNEVLALRGTSNRDAVMLRLR